MYFITLYMRARAHVCIYMYVFIMRKFSLVIKTCFRIIRIYILSKIESMNKIIFSTFDLLLQINVI